MRVVSRVCGVCGLLCVSMASGRVRRSRKLDSSMCVLCVFTMNAAQSLREGPVVCGILDFKWHSILGIPNNTRVGRARRIGRINLVTTHTPLKKTSHAVVPSLGSVVEGCSEPAS